MRNYSVGEVAGMFSRDSRTIRDWIKTGCPTPGGLVRLEAVKAGRWWSVPEEELVIFRHRLVHQTAAARPRLSDEAETIAPS